MTTAPTQEATTRPPSRVWAGVGVVGELLITVGVLLLLLVAYQLLWTNVTAGRAASEAATQLQDSWTRPPTTSDEVPPDDDRQRSTSRTARPSSATAFALMYIPRLSDKVWGMPVLESVELADLSRGIGHYPDSQLPARRATSPSPRTGRPMVSPSVTSTGCRTGTASTSRPATHGSSTPCAGTRSSHPSDTWVIDPVPGDPGQEPVERLITLTTCNPRWASTTRWIWWGDLTTNATTRTRARPHPQWRRAARCIRGSGTTCPVPPRFGC